MIELFNIDSVKHLPTMPDNSVDSVVTDPPYELGFMGKAWDKSGITYNVSLWREVLRVLKPGGHLLAFGGTRTYHRMVCAIEDAGFEIRDQIQWIYGSGFPKSKDVGKAIDNKFNAIRPTETKMVGDISNRRYVGKDKSPRVERSVSNNEPQTELAKQWDGWGTALKPANEPICLARKPLSEKTVAENVLKWGTGGINIDGCRVEYTGKTDPRTFGGKWKTDKAAQNIYEGGYEGSDQTVSSRGRFPANVIHDGSEEVLSGFPNSKAGSFKGNGSKSGGIWSESTGKPAGMEYGDSGSASRFFYCAKASKNERNMGLNNADFVRHSDRTKENGMGGANPRNRTNTPKQNFHPTVKPIALMQYLCRLITPPSGIVLDPFMGSGTTGIGAINEGFSFIGIELSPEYFEIAQKRIEAAKQLLIFNKAQQKLF